MDWKSLPREKTDCILCGSGSNRVLSVQDSWPVVKCTECGLVYLRERPSEEAVEKMYSRSYYEDGDVGYQGYIETYRKYRDVFERIFERRDRDLRKHTPGNRLLEIGCAYGFLLDFLRERGWEVTGVEVSPLSSAYARDTLGLNVLTGTVEEVELPEGSFDVILLLDVLEHLHRPYDVLTRIRQLLAPDGVLVVQCPWELYHWEEIAEALLKGMRPGTIRPDAIPVHLYFFGPSSLEGVLQKGGFVIAARQSGNYGEVRRRIQPPLIRTGNPIVTFFRFIYFRLGFQRLLYALARFLRLGNGLIRYARPAGDPE